MKRIIFASLCLFLISSSARADEVITTLHEGDPAPFTGTLLNPEAAARILAESEAATLRCNLRVETEVNLARAEHQREVDIFAAKLDTCEFLSTSRLELLQNQNEFLLDEMERYKKPHEVWWFVGGTALGAIVVTGLVYALTPAM